MTQAASPKARRRLTGAGAEAAEVSGVAVEVGEGGDSSWSLMTDNVNGHLEFFFHFEI